MGQNRPAHGGHRDRRVHQGVLQKPSIKRHLETETDRGAAARLDVDDGDAKRLISTADNVEHVGNALAVDGTDTPGQRRLVIQRPPYGLAPYGVDADLRALV